ncbi:MAG: sensor histidine kinase [Acidimicrobiales bacterium]
MRALRIPPNRLDDELAVRGFLLSHAGMIAVLVVIQVGMEGLAPVPATIPMLVTIGVVLGTFRSERAGAEPSEWIWLALVVPWIALVLIDASFLQAMFTMLPATFALVSWPRSAVAAAVMPIVWGAVEFAADEPFWEWALLPLGTWALSCLMGWWVYRVIEQSEERAVLLATLEATRAELAEAQRAEGARMERDRIARDIHDTLAQGFSSILLHSRGALARGDADSARQTLGLVEQVASEHLGEARRLVADRADESLGGRTLTEALQRVATTDEPVAHLHVDGSAQQLSGAIEVAVLRIAQEAVANARKHADAGRIDITLAYTDREVLLDIVDNGSGFDVHAPPRTVGSQVGGLGLTGIRARTAELGGTVVVESADQAGTSISVALPTGTK